MDIVSRLKIFMNYLNIANSQFADSCRIPRPTISQILNGRNKKISDELISKIHETYPSLSVLWLMFGEGDMLVDSNIKTSDVQNAPIIDFGNNENIGSEEIIPTLDFDANDSENVSNNFIAGDITPKSEESSFLQSAQTGKQPTETKTSISFNTNAAKKIVNIMVFYSDNSFESFIPASSRK